MRPVRVERERNGYRVFDAYGFGLTISDIGRDTCEEIAAAINAYYPPLRVPFEPFDLGDVHNDHLQICGEINKLWRAINELGGQAMNAEERLRLQIKDGWRCPVCRKKYTCRNWTKDCAWYDAKVDAWRKNEQDTRGD